MIIPKWIWNRDFLLNFHALHVGNEDVKKSCSDYVCVITLTPNDYMCRHRHLPKPVYKASALRRIMADAQRRKEERRRAHSAPGSMPKESVRKRRIIKEIEWVFGASAHGVSV